MTRQLYPLNALRAFEAAARHLSFVRAADELHVTPAAISHQVKGLEDFLGVQLFRRLPKGLLLSETGQRMLPGLRDGLMLLENAVEAARAPHVGGPLTISVAPMFAAKWLVPRLDRFSKAHPEIDLRISSSLSLVDFRKEDFDVAIRLGKGRYPKLEAIALFDEYVTPMCSPRLLEAAVSEDLPVFLAKQTLLHDDSLAFHPGAPTWRTWLDAAGITGLDAGHGPRFSHPDHAIQAAVDGAGVVLGWGNLAADDIAAGRLVAPFDPPLPIGLGFYAVCPPSHLRRPNIIAFRDWLLDEIHRNAPPYEKSSGT